MSSVVEQIPVINQKKSDINIPETIKPYEYKEISWTGRIVRWLHNTPGGHLAQAIGGMLGAAACGMAGVALLIAAIKGIIFGALLVATLVFAPFGFAVIAASFALAATNNIPFEAMVNCWDFAMDQLAVMKAKSLQ